MNVGHVITSFTNQMSFDTFFMCLFLMLFHKNQIGPVISNPKCFFFDISDPWVLYYRLAVVFHINENIRDFTEITE